MRKRLWLVIIPILLFILLAVSVEAGITTGFEGWAYSESVEHMSPVLTGIIKAITHLGDPPMVIGVCFLLILLPKTRKTIALPVSVSVIVSSVLNLILKNCFARERPDILRLINETSYSFPSGHAMINTSLYTMLILLIYRYIKSYPRKIALSGVCAALIGAISYSRVYLGVHYAGDILGGWLIGFAVTVLVYWVWSSKAFQQARDE